MTNRLRDARIKEGRSGRTVVATLILTLAVTAAARAQPTPPAYPSWKITGLVFGDYYAFFDHHDPRWDGQHGFWIRRGYLTYEHTFSEPGVYHYYCSIHGTTTAGMVGSVTVADE